MKHMRWQSVVGLIMMWSISVNQAVAEKLTQADQEKAYAGAKAVVEQIFEAANSKRYLAGLEHYSDDANAFFVSDGIIQSLDELKKAYVVAGAGVEDLHNDILKWNVRVIRADLVSFTLPVSLRLKLKGIPEYTGKIIWSGLLQYVDGQWLVIQSHESWLNAAEVAAALSGQS